MRGRGEGSGLGLGLGFRIRVGPRALKAASFSPVTRRMSLISAS